MLELYPLQKKDDAKAGGGGMFKGLIDTIIGNLQLSISNVHIRYEVSRFLFVNQGYHDPTACAVSHAGYQLCCMQLPHAQ